MALVVFLVLLGLVVVVAHAVITARLGTYPHTGAGYGLLAVDCTWSLLNTAAGLAFLGYARLHHNPVEPDLGRGTTNVRITRGVFPGFATTVGPFIAGASPRIIRHERIHVFQARVFGPLYGVLVGLHYAILIVVPYWLLYHDYETFPIHSVRDYFLHGVYRHVWHEVWAYRAAPAGT